VNLAAAQIGSQLDCRGAHFGPFTARAAAVKQGFFWSDIKGVTELDLGEASVGSISDDEASWPAKGHLNLDGFAYSSISGGPTSASARLSWLDRQADFRSRPYRQLETVLRAAGDTNGANQVLFELARRDRADKRRRLATSPARLVRLSEDLLIQETTGYGVYPIRLVRPIFALAMLGWILYRRAHRVGAMVPTDKDAYNQLRDGGRAPAYYPRFSPWIYCVENSFPVVKFGQDDHWQPDPSPSRRVCLPRPARGSRAWFRDLLFVRLPDQTTSPVVLRWARWGMIGLGWALTTLFLHYVVSK